MMRLPVSVVKELLKRNVPTARFSPEAIEAAGTEAESFLATLGADAFAVAQRDGRSTVMEERLLVAPPEPSRNDVSIVILQRSPSEPVVPRSRAEQALARANLKLKGAGMEPELLGSMNVS